MIVLIIVELDVGRGLSLVFYVGIGTVVVSK